MKKGFMALPPAAHGAGVLGSASGSFVDASTPSGTTLLAPGVLCGAATPPSAAALCCSVTAASGAAAMCPEGAAAGILSGSVLETIVYAVVWGPPVFSCASKRSATATTSPTLPCSSDGGSIAVLSVQVTVVDTN